MSHVELAKIPAGADRDVLLTDVEAAPLIGVSRQSMRRWRMEYNRGQDLIGPRWVTVGRRTIRYRLSELRRYLATREVAA